MSNTCSILKVLAYLRSVSSFYCAPGALLGIAGMVMKRMGLVVVHGSLYQSGYLHQKTVHYGPRVSAWLMSRSTDSLLSWLSSQGCLYGEQPWKIKIVSSPREESFGLFSTIKNNNNNNNNNASLSGTKCGQICLKPVLKDWHFLNLRFLYCNPFYVHMSPRSCYSSV